GRRSCSFAMSVRRFCLYWEPCRRARPAQQARCRQPTMSWAIWISSPPGRGKSGLAREAAAQLEAAGPPVVVLELDEVRKVVTPAATDSDVERDVVYRALVYMAAALTESGTPVIIDATAHRREWRELARRRIPRCAEVDMQLEPSASAAQR